MDQISNYVMLALAAVTFLFWIFLYARYHGRYGEMIQAIDSKQYFLPQLFFIGFGAADLFKINLKTEAGRRLERSLTELYGEKYAEYYHRVIVAGQFTYTLTIVPLSLLFGFATGSVSTALLLAAAAAVLVVYLDTDVTSAIKKKREELLSDYPEVVSQLALLVNAGMVLREAWEKVAQNSDRVLYREMQNTTLEMQNGIPEVDALYHFAQRCSVKEIRKLASMLTQNLQKGNAELAAGLKFTAAESWEEKQQTAKKKAEIANQKLLLPLLIMFGGIMLMIIIPIFANLFQ